MTVKTSSSPYVPWRDRRGNFSAFKAITFGLLFAPAFWMYVMYAMGGFSHSPIPSLIYFSGIWAIWGLLLTLTVTPLSTSLGWTALMSVRRMLGLAGLGYTILHIAVYVVLRKYNGKAIFDELIGRWTIIFATLSSIGLLALGLTSTDAAVRTLGSRIWHRLQSTVYVLSLLAILHFLLSPLAVGPLPFTMAGIYFWLMTWRVARYCSQEIRRPKVLLRITLISTCFTFAFELVWLDVYQHLSPYMIAMANLELDLGLSATWQILILGLTICSLSRNLAKQGNAP